MKRILYMIIAMLIPLFAVGQLTSGSKQIKAASEKIGLSNLIPDSVKNADTIIVKGDRLLSVRISNGQVEHLGCRIFLKEQRQLAPSPVYDYLEFACLDKLYSITENPFVYNNLVITGGTWEDILANAAESTCSLTRQDNDSYQVEWNKNDGSVITATFPIGYETLYMMSRTEIESKFISELRTTKVTEQAELPEPDPSALKPAGKDVFVLEGGHYLITDVNQNLYYKKSETGTILIWDKQNPAESVANMFISHDKWLTGYPIEIKIPTHERKTEELKITVRQLLACANKTGCKVYWGLESLTETELKGTLFLYNPAYGFDHVFNITCDPRLIGTNDLKFTSLAALFSPTTNIHNLFAKRRGKSTPKKIE